MTRRGLTKTMRFEVFNRDNFSCAYCGARPPDVVLQCDHLVPVSRGGRNELENLRTACSACNLGKGARLIEDRATIERQLEMRLEGCGQRVRATPDVGRLFYIQGILRNRLGDRRLDCVRPLRDCLAHGVSLDSLERAAKQARDWAGFERLLNVQEEREARAVTIRWRATECAEASGEDRPCDRDAAGSSPR